MLQNSSTHSDCDELVLNLPAAAQQRASDATVDTVSLQPQNSAPAQDLLSMLKQRVPETNPDEMGLEPKNIIPSEAIFPAPKQRVS